MLFYTVGQSQVFIAMASAGVLIGLLYDLFRSVRRLLVAGPVLTLAIDLVFGAASAVFVIAFLYKANYAELRFYALLGAGCGLVLYQCSLGQLLRWVASKMGRLLSSAKQRFFRTGFMKRLLK